MVRKAAITALLFLSSPTHAQTEAPEEKPWFLRDGWAELNAPRGFLVADDGKVLINIGTSSAGSEYGLVLDDYAQRDASYPKVWFYGYHQHDKSVVYRTSKQQVSFDCRLKTLQTTFFISFRADKSTLYTGNYAQRTEPVVPGSLGEQWYQYACRPK